eukprot:3018158-Amphidinium_carterae.1
MARALYSTFHRSSFHAPVEASWTSSDAFESMLSARVVLTMALKDLQVSPLVGVMWSSLRNGTPSGCTKPGFPTSCPASNNHQLDYIGHLRIKTQKSTPREPPRAFQTLL